MPDERDHDDAWLDDEDDGDIDDGADEAVEPDDRPELDPLENPTRTKLEESLWEERFESDADGLVPWGLTPKQWAFVCEYVVSFNAVDAARRAGFSTKSSSASTQIMRRPRVREAIQWILRSRARDFAATHERILQELCAIAFRDPADYAHWKGTSVRWKDSAKLDPVKRRAVKRIAHREQLTKIGVTTTTEIEFESKLRALEILAKATGLLRERTTEESRGAFVEWRDAVMAGRNIVRPVEVEQLDAPAEAPTEAPEGETGGSSEQDPEGGVGDGA